MRRGQTASGPRGHALQLPARPRGVLCAAPSRGAARESACGAPALPAVHACFLTGRQGVASDQNRMRGHTHTRVRATYRFGCTTALHARRCARPWTAGLACRRATCGSRRRLPKERRLQGMRTATANRRLGPPGRSCPRSSAWARCWSTCGGGTPTASSAAARSAKPHAQCCCHAALVLFATMHIRHAPKYIAAPCAHAQYRDEDDLAEACPGKWEDDH